MITLINDGQSLVSATVRGYPVKTYDDCLGRLAAACPDTDDCGVRWSKSNPAFTRDGGIPAKHTKYPWSGMGPMNFRDFMH